MTNDELLHKWINGTLSAEEASIFRERPEYESLTEVYRLTDHLEAPNFDEGTMLSNILKIKKEENKPPQKTAKVINFSSYFKYGIAASLLILASWFFLFNPKEQKVELIANNKKINGHLPDQSTFVLNLDSRLTYNKKDWSNERSLNLEGEAFFKVEKGAKFSVNTKNGSVQVLGTQFNVWSRNDVLEVRCQSGKVAVLSPKQKVIKELNPKDVVRVLADGKIETWKSSSTENANWTQGISHLKDAPLARILSEIERQFDVQIDANNIDTAISFSCNFQHKDLNLALKTALPSDISYRIEGEKVVLFKNE